MANLLNIELSDIQPDPEQPRQDFNEESLLDLANSINAIGVMQAITVRPTPSNYSGAKYMIIAGERRWRASKIAGRKTIPAIVKTSEDDSIKAQQLTENLFREDLNPVEKAEFIQSRINELKNNGYSDATQRVASELGVSTSWVSKNTSILKLSSDIKDLAKVGKIRDYGLVKKVEKLKGEKREEALKLIEKGCFNGKEFFKRKRYDKKTIVEEVKEPKPKPKSESVKFFFKKEEVIKIMKKTDFSCVLDDIDTEWDSDIEMIGSYIEKFKSWALEEA